MTNIIINTIKAQRDGYLDSPGLPPDWKHGWNAAVAHVVHTVEQEQIAASGPGRTTEVANAFVSDAIASEESELGYEGSDMFGHAQVVQYNDDGSVAGRYMVTVTAKLIED